MFEEICSIYADALDNVGRYVDHDTGECIQQMTIRDFCLTDRWRLEVEHLRAMRRQYGSKAKKMQEYIDTKKRLPGATLSGLFAVWDDECVRKDGSIFFAPVSRRETHLRQHTGWLAIDIDLADNVQLSDFENIRMVCRFRPEVALLMRSCSGTGYFGLVRLAYPERHKEQFKALIREYAALGITLDKQCGNIGRVRFASWDAPEHIYINTQAVAYTGVYVEQTALSQRSTGYDRYASGYPGGGYNGMPNGHQKSSTEFWADQRAQDRLLELVVKAIASQRINITESYEDWCKVGWALKGHPYGEQMFHELSACSQKYNQVNTVQKWQQLGASNTVTRNYLLHAAREVLGETQYRDIKRRVWDEMRG
jgi:hypothetical protein